jgi:hypothetical protein
LYKDAKEVAISRKYEYGNLYIYSLARNFTKKYFVFDRPSAGTVQNCMGQRQYFFSTVKTKNFSDAYK